MFGLQIFVGVGQLYKVVASAPRIFCSRAKSCMIAHETTSGWAQYLSR